MSNAMSNSISDSMRDRMGQVVCDLIETDPHTALVLADISTAYFLDALKKYPERVVNLGIMEQTAVSLAAGFALEGFHPIVHSIAPFVTERPLEQIKDDFCYQELGGTLISIGASYDYGTDGMTHHGSADVPILKTLPRMQICVPGTPDEFETLLRQTYSNGEPTYIRTSVQENDASRPISFGKLHLEREGKDGVVVAVGPMLERTLAATAEMDLTVLYATTVAPFDEETLRNAVAHASPNVILVESYYEGALAQDITKALRAVASRIETIGVPHQILDRYGPPERHDRELGLTTEGIQARITNFLKTSHST
ncbi:MAG: transketolase C-terminal domain-containing protein [Chloroflexota bacterium]